MSFITQGKTNLTYLLIIVILAVIVGGGILGYQHWWGPSQEKPSEEVPPPEGWRYELEHYDYDTDARIIRINTGTGEKKVLVESIIESYPELKREKAEWDEIANDTLFKVAFPKGSSKLYFTHQRTDIGHHRSLGFVSFDVNTRQFFKMNISKYCEGHFYVVIYLPKDFTVGAVLSPDEKRVAIVSIDQLGDFSGLSQILRLLDLEKDEAKVLVVLSGNETFNAGGLGGGSLFNIEWLDDETIEYGVYDNSISLLEGVREEIGPGPSQIRPLIEKRTVNIKEEVVLPEIEQAREMLSDFLDARLEGNESLTKSYLTEKALSQYLQPEVYLMPTPGSIYRSSCPPLSICHWAYPILREIDKTKFEAKIGLSWMKNPKEATWTEITEILMLIKIGDKYLIDSVEQESQGSFG